MPGMTAAPPASPITAELLGRRDDNLARLKEWLRIPSVSAQSDHAGDCRTAADWVAGQMRDAGLTVEIVETAGHPIVYGEALVDPAKPTVLLYGHYDVQPPEPLDLWTTPAFEPTEREGALYARGATDDKGQVLTHVLAAQAWHAAGGLPVNVKMVIEGEEEVGSNNLEPFLREHADRLACDVAVISDTSQFARGTPAITYGLRGILACEVQLTGPRRDLHSGVFGGSVANPANVIARLVASLHDDDGRVAIEGFYDDVEALSDDERERLAALPFDEAAYYRAIGLEEGFGESGYSANEQRWARPTCDVNGMLSGYTGEGPKTIVPSKAMAKITCRLVPGQRWDILTDAIERHLRERLPPGITMEFRRDHGANAIVFATDSPYMAAARAAIAAGFGTEPVFIREGGSIPVVATLEDVLGVETLLLGWGQNTDNLHAPDEHFSIDDFHNGTAAAAALLGELAGESDASAAGRPGGDS